jgi:hypothetical protein
VSYIVQSISLLILSIRLETTTTTATRGSTVPSAPPQIKPPKTSPLRSPRTRSPWTSPLRCTNDG